MPKPTAVIQVEGVLRKTVAGSPLDAGRRLYHGLAGTYGVVLNSVEGNREHLKLWLSMEGFDKHAHVVYGDTPVPPLGNRWHAVAQDLRMAYGYDVALCVLPDPFDAIELILHGFPTLLFTQPAYALPEWRPDASKGVRPWADLMTEIAAQKILRASDKRAEESDLR